MPNPGKPQLREHYIRDARGYVTLAEELNGPIPGPVNVDWPWGDALSILDYRMDPGNTGVLTAARIDACALANNHVLDFGVRGLEETISR